MSYKYKHFSSLASFRGGGGGGGTFSLSTGAFEEGLCA